MVVEEGGSQWKRGSGRQLAVGREREEETRFNKAGSKTGRVLVASLEKKCQP